MFNSRSKSPAMDQLLSAAHGVGKSARQFSNQIETWANDGYETVRGAAKSDAAFWGAISMGIGAAAGGLYALWRTTDRRSWRAARRQIAALSSDVIQSVRSVVPDSLAFAGLGKSRGPKRRSRKSGPPGRSNGAAVMALDAAPKRKRSMRSTPLLTDKPKRRRTRKAGASRRAKTA